jgi:hypothetical protein
MVQLPTVTEGEYSATLAALDERANRLGLELVYFQQQPQSPERDECIDHVVEGLHQANMARLRLSEAEPWQQIPVGQTSWSAA